MIKFEDETLGGIEDKGERFKYNGGALREPSVGKGRYDLISPFATRRLARWYELGALKYGDRNWETGLSMTRCVDSAKRHLDKFLMGMRDEDHLAACAWNIFAIMHMQELEMKEFDDLPKWGYETKEDTHESYKVKIEDFVTTSDKIVNSYEQSEDQSKETQP